MYKWENGKMGKYANMQMGKYANEIMGEWEMGSWGNHKILKKGKKCKC